MKIQMQLIMEKSEITLPPPREGEKQVLTFGGSPPFMAVEYRRDTDSKVMFAVFIGNVE